MRLINRKTDYALRALCVIAKGKKSVVTVEDLVEELHMPKPFLRKIFQQLSKAGLVASHRGYKGGFVLKKDAARIRLTQVMRVFQGPLELNRCLFQRDICPNRRICFLRRELEDIERHVVRRLQAITLAKLVKKDGDGK
jgi:Rrf2 family protein